MDGQDIVVKDIAMVRPLKNGFAAAQKSFSLLVGLHIIVNDYRMLNSITERRKNI